MVLAAKGLADTVYYSAQVLPRIVEGIKALHQKARLNQKPYPSKGLLPLGSPRTASSLVLPQDVVYHSWTLPGCPLNHVNHPEHRIVTFPVAEFFGDTQHPHVRLGIIQADVAGQEA